jgi:hypothetical protein
MRATRLMPADAGHGSERAKRPNVMQTGPDAGQAAKSRMSSSFLMIVVQTYKIAERYRKFCL